MQAPDLDCTNFIKIPSSIQIVCAALQIEAQPTFQFVDQRISRTYFTSVQY